MSASLLTERERRSVAAVAGAILQDGGLLIVLIVVLAAVTGSIQPRFWTRLNMLNVAREAAYLMIVSLGQMLVMIAGGFDLSVGAVGALASVVTASSMAALSGGDVTGVLLFAVPIALALGTGAAVGLANGACVGLLGLSPFMTTLAATSIVEGVTLYTTQGIPIYGLPSGFGAVLGRGTLLSLPISLLIALAILALICFVQRLLPMGRKIYAVGGNPKIASLSGVRPAPVLLLVYGWCSALAAGMGVLMTARVSSGQPTMGATLVIESISAAVIGGVPLRGGVGRAERVALAVVFLALVDNCMNLLRIDSKLQTLVQGAVVIVAIAVERLFAGRQRT